MLLFKKAFWAGLESGAITLTFRRWQKPHVRAGGRYRCHPIGVLEVDAIALVTVASITADDARASGFTTRDALLAYLGELGPLSDDTEVYRVTLHHGGDGDRVELALADTLSSDDVAAIAARLARLDAASDRPWTAATLALIGAQPRTAASKLAPQLGRETQPFKIDVRKLKKLGLTQSFEVGYEISPRGRAYLAAVPPSSPKPKQSSTRPKQSSKPKQSSPKPKPRKSSEKPRKSSPRPKPSSPKPKPKRARARPAVSRGAAARRRAATGSRSA